MPYRDKIADLKRRVAALQAERIADVFQPVPETITTIETRDAKEPQSRIRGSGLNVVQGQYPFSLNVDGCYSGPFACFIECDVTTNFPRWFWMNAGVIYWGTPETNPFGESAFTIRSQLIDCYNPPDPSVPPAFDWRSHIAIPGIHCICLWEKPYLSVDGYDPGTYNIWIGPSTQDDPPRPIDYPREWRLVCVLGRLKVSTTSKRYFVTWEQSQHWDIYRYSCRYCYSPSPHNPPGDWQEGASWTLELTIDHCPPLDCPPLD